MVYLGDAGLLVQMELQQLFEINFGVGPQLDEHHQFGAILGHLVEGIFGGAPERFPRSCQFQRACMDQTGLDVRLSFHDDLGLLDSILSQALLHPLQRGLAHNIEKRQRQRRERQLLLRRSCVHENQAANVHSDHLKTIPNLAECIEVEKSSGGIFWPGRPA